MVWREGALPELPGAGSGRWVTSLDIRKNHLGKTEWIFWVQCHGFASPVSSGSLGHTFVLGEIVELLKVRSTWFFVINIHDLEPQYCHFLAGRWPCTSDLKSLNLWFLIHNTGLVLPPLWECFNIKWCIKSTLVTVNPKANAGYHCYKEWVIEMSRELSSKPGPYTLV